MMTWRVFLVIVLRGRRRDRGKARDGLQWCKKCCRGRVGVSWSRVGARAPLRPRRARVANTVALPGNCSGAARARGQPQTLDFGYWTRWLHFAVVRVCVKLDCDALGQRKVKFVVLRTAEQPEGVTLRSYLHSIWRYGRGGLLRVSQGCRAAPGTSERGSRCAFVVGCRKRLPRWAGWMHDSSPRPLASREIPAARRTRVQLITGWAREEMG